jgi:hypothetical protein
MFPFEGAFNEGAFNYQVEFKGRKKEYESIILKQKRMAKCLRLLKVI